MTTTKPNALTSPLSSVANISLGFMGVAFLVYVLHEGKPVIMPFVIAVFLWYLINALARAIGYVRVSGKVLPRKYRYILAILFFVVLFGGIGTLVSQNIVHVMRAAPDYQRSLEPILAKTVGWFHLDHEPTFSDLEDYLDFSGLVTTLAGIFTGLAGKTLVVVIYTGFLLYEQKFFNHKIMGIIEDPRTEEHVRIIINKIDTRIQRYIGIKSLNSAIDSILTFVVLSVVGLDFAEFWAVLAFFLHFIPYAGSLIAISVPSLIALIQFGDPAHMLMVGVAIGLCHAFIGHFLEPMMMGSNLNLSPIFIISFLAMWGLIWGIPGMFLAVPILAILVIIFSQFPKTRPMAILMSKTGNLAE